MLLLDIGKKIVDWLLATLFSMITSFIWLIKATTHLLGAVGMTVVQLSDLEFECSLNI